MSTASDILQLIDQISGETVTYRITTTWYDGSILDDSKIDGVIYRKLGNVYYRRQLDNKDVLKINTVNELRNFNAYYEGQEISLLGYYQSGDKKPLIYTFTVSNFSTLVDDGGAVIKTDRGSWIAQFNNEISIKDFGGIDDSSTDNYNIISKINSYLLSYNPTETNRLTFRIPVSNNYYETSISLRVPAFVHLYMDCPLVSNTDTITTVIIGSSDKINTKTNIKINVRSKVVSWTSLTHRGFEVINSQNCNIEIVQSIGFFRSGIFIGNTQGFVYNNITLGQFANNREDLRLTNIGNGWCNENSFFGGRFHRISSINPNLDKYGIVITSEDGVYTNNNNNNFYKPSFEYNYSGTGDTVPVVIENGVQNNFRDVRFETGEVPCAIRTLNASTDNVFEIGYLGVSSFAYSRLVQDNGLYPNTRVSSRKNGIRQTGNKYLVYNSGFLPKKLFTKDGVHVYAPDETFVGVSSSGANSKNSATGITVTTTNVNISTTRGIGVKVDTTKNKRFVINKYILNGGGSGRIMIRCYDGAGVILTNAKTYVKGEATLIPVYSANYGGCWRMGSDSDGNMFIIVDTDVKSIDVIIGGGTSACDLQSFSIEALDFPTSIIDPYNKKGWYSSEAPITPMYETGSISYSTTQTTGRLAGWIFNGTIWTEMVPDPLLSLLQYNDDFNI